MNPQPGLLPAVRIGLLLLSITATGLAQEQGEAVLISKAVKDGLRVLEKGTKNYAEERNCFTCHHQTLPMLAQATAHEHGFTINRELLQQQARFTHDSFSDRHESLRKGNGVGGRSMTVAYAAWALSLADWKPDETTSALVEYLLKSQKKDGNYFTNNSRPPLEDSPATSVTIATYYQQVFATTEQAARVKDKAAKALAWLVAYKPNRQEDYNSRLWGLSLLGADPNEIQSARKLVLAAQREDGGWSQLPTMTSDSYATGQALWMLQETGTSPEDPAYQRGVKFLLKTQREDGSWFVKTRSKAIQKHFESGFPHGKDQFISVCGTSWAVAALAAAHPHPEKPLP